MTPSQVLKKQGMRGHIQEMQKKEHSNLPRYKHLTDE